MWRRRPNKYQGFWPADHFHAAAETWRWASRRQRASHWQTERGVTNSSAARSKGTACEGLNGGDHHVVHTVGCLSSHPLTFWAPLAAMRSRQRRCLGSASRPSLASLAADPSPKATELVTWRPQHRHRVALCGRDAGAQRALASSVSSPWTSSWPASPDGPLAPWRRARSHRLCGCSRSRWPGAGHPSAQRARNVTGVT